MSKMTQDTLLGTLPEVLRKNRQIYVLAQVFAAALM